jgi:putative cardiolipin synthase
VSSLRTTISRNWCKTQPPGPPLILGAAIAVALISGCAGQPPGANFPRQSSVALAHPEQTFLGAKFAQAAKDHGGNSGFRILSVGVDGFLTRVQMIDAAERTIDLQYFIFRGDETGRLITAALLRAADRGVHVRVLIDDGDTVAGDEQIFALDGHPSVEIRVFNPFAYRGHSDFLRGMEFTFNMRRLDYRMHNKLLVVDNSVALIGGRNIGNQYFQMDPESQFADDDVFTVGPVVQQLSATFDEFWNSTQSIPAAALGHARHPASDLEKHRQVAQGSKPMLSLDSPGIDYVAMLRTDEPYAGMIVGHLPLVWASAEIASDSPDKKNVEKGVTSGRLMSEPVVKAAAQAHTEILMVTPYFVPSGDEMHLLDTLLRNNVRVAILTNSLESAPGLLAQAGYTRYRLPLLDDGADLYEVRARLGSRRGSGQTARISQFGNYGLHAKLYVFDRERFFIGSMNFDQRSKHLNTEIGLIIDSPELAQQTAARFDSMTQPESAYVLSVRYQDSGPGENVVWDTVANGKPVEYTQEPAQNRWQKFKVRFLAMLPFRREL